MNQSKFLLLLLAVFSGHFGVAQMQQTVSFTPVWEGEIPVGTDMDLFGGPKAPWFKGALLDEQVVNLPFMDLVVEVAENEVLVLGNVEAEGKMSKQNGEFAGTSRGMAAAADGYYPAGHAVLGQIELRAGKRYQHIRIYPIRVSPGTGSIVQATRIEAAYRRTASATLEKPKQDLNSRRVFPCSWHR